MRHMGSTPTATRPDVEHEAEAAKQAEISAAIVDNTPAVDAAPSEDVEQAPKVTLRAVDVEHYPLTVSVVGAGEDGLVFADEDSRIDVLPAVAEQVAYMPNVEVVE